MSESAIFFRAAASHVNKPRTKSYAFHLPTEATDSLASVFTKGIFIVWIETVNVLVFSLGYNQHDKM